MLRWCKIIFFEPDLTRAITRMSNVDEREKYMDIIKFAKNNWDVVADEEKLVLLQQAEDYFAEIQSREKRIVKKAENDNECSSNAEAQYNFLKPEYLYVKNYDNGIKTFMSIIHEGIHAMFDDAFNGRLSCVKLYRKIDIKDLIDQRKKRDIIYNHFYQSNRILLFNLEYIEEKITHFETKCYALQEFFRVCNNDSEKEQWFSEIYEPIFAEEVNRRIYLRAIQKDFKTTYENEVLKINYSDYKEKMILDLKKPNTLIFHNNIVYHFSSQAQIYENIQNTNLLNKKNDNVNKFISNLLKFHID